MYSDNSIPLTNFHIQPAYPSVAGQSQPQLNLAGVETPMTSLAGGNFTDSTPPQITAVPSLSSDSDQIGMLGIDPEVPYFQLNLAGNEINVPGPDRLAAAPGAAETNGPTFSLPDFSVPAVRDYDLTAPGIDQVPAFAPDPHAGDLLQFAHPIGLEQYGG